jgi:uncharacterized membrane protein YfcA
MLLVTPLQRMPQLPSIDISSPWFFLEWTSSLPEVLGQSSPLESWQIYFLVVLSFVVGLLGGTVGLALGTVRLPALLLLGVPAPIAGGTNILVSTLVGLAGAYHHLKEKRVNWKLVAYMGFPSVVGAFIGGYTASIAPINFLILLTGGLSTWQGVDFTRMARQIDKPNAKGNLPAKSTTAFGREHHPLEAGIGLILGLVGGAVGLMLGSLRLPAMIRIMKMSPGIASGTNMVIGVSLGVFGFIGHLLHGEVDLPILVAMGIPGIVGTYIGAHFTGRISPSALLRLMGLVLATVGLILMGNVIFEWLTQS